MSDPITPLTPEQTVVQENQAAEEGWLHRSLVAIDQAFNVVVLRGQPDETISSHAARAAEQGKRWGRGLSAFLNIFQRDHGAKAQAGDAERGQAIAAIENQSGGINKPSQP